jgi:hypothetical protein
MEDMIGYVSTKAWPESPALATSMRCIQDLLCGTGLDRVVLTAFKAPLASVWKGVYRSVKECPGG